MIWPLWILAVPTALFGLVLLHPPDAVRALHIDLATAIAGTALSVAGLTWGLEAAATWEDRDAILAVPAGPRTFLRDGYRLDAVQQALVVRPYEALARLVAGGRPRRRRLLCASHPCAGPVGVRGAGAGPDRVRHRVRGVARRGRRRRRPARSGAHVTTANSGFVADHAGWLLAALIVLPLAGSLVLLALRRVTEDLAARIATVVSGVTLLLAIVVAAGAAPYDRAVPGAAVDLDWVPALGVHWHLALDGVSMPLVLLTALLGLLVCWHVVRVRPVAGRVRGLVACFLAVEGGALATFLARDLLLFFVAFEVVLVPMWFVVAFWGDAATAPVTCRWRPLRSRPGSAPAGTPPTASSSSRRWAPPSCSSACCSSRSAPARPTSTCSRRARLEPVAGPG